MNSPSPSPSPGPGPDPNGPSPIDAKARPLRTGLQLLLPLWGMLALLLLALGLLALGARWLLTTEEGARRVLSVIPGVKVQGFRGTLLGDTWQAEKLHVAWSKDTAWVDVQTLRASGVQWQWRPVPGVWLGLRAQRVVAQSVELQTGPSSKLNPKPTPANIAPPLQLQFAEVRADSFRINSAPPFVKPTIEGLLLDARAGQEFVAERFSFEDFGISAAGSFRMGNIAPLAMKGSASLRPTAEGDSPRWGAVLNANGNIEKLGLTSTLRGRPVPGRDAPALDVDAQLLLLHRWLLAGLKLQTQSLDLASLWAKAPSTQLSGTAELTGGGDGKPLAASITLDNLLPGRFDEQRVPIQKLALQAQGELARPDRLEVSTFEMSLADAARPAGRINGSALWQGNELSLNTVLASVTPQRVDKRAAAMTLSGPLQATLRGVTSPNFNATANPAPLPQSASWKLDLQGQLERAQGAAQTVQMQMEGSVDAQKIDLPKVHLQAGEAMADLRATVSKIAPASSQSEWRIDSTGSLQNFDPQPWWPGDSHPAWRQGPHRLSGQWVLDLRVPADAARLEPPALAQRVAGNGTLSLRDSLLAGVPLAGEATLSNLPGNAAGVSQLKADLRLAGNQVLLDASGDPTSSGPDAGRNDRWRLDLKAEALAALAPLTRLHPALADWVPRQGSATATLSADGRWPRLRTEGTAKVSQLQIGALAVAKGSANWRIGASPEAPAAAEGAGDKPLSLQLEMTGLVYAKQRADNLRAELRGTWADHHIDITGALPVVPPEALEQWLGVPTQSGTRAHLQAKGAWRADAAGGGTWKANVEKLVLGAWDGVPTIAPLTTGWAEASDLQATVQFNQQGEWLSLQAEPGKLRLAQAIALRWDEVRASRTPGQSSNPTQVQLKADIEPFALAPILARAQPTLGWRGDLRLAARLQIRAGEKFDADVVFERQDGDLAVSTGDAAPASASLAASQAPSLSSSSTRLQTLLQSQALGLTDFKLALAAHDGVWTFTPSLHGKTLGDIDGKVRIQSTPERRWPLPESPITGQVQLRVADIGIWGTWVPPGWRLTGEIRSMASIAGSFGEPLYTGELTGSGLGVRNLLEGVNVTDGQIAMTLRGDTAQVDTFTLKGGDGNINIVGGVVLGRKPQVLLQVKAERFRALGRVDRQIIASGNAAFVFDADQCRLEGQVRVDEGLFDASRSGAPTLDDDVVVLRPGQAADVVVDTANPKTRRYCNLALDLDMGQQLRVKGRGLDTELRGQLRVTGQNARPVINGTIRTENGTYAAYGQKLKVERGIVAFAGTPDNPRLDILALRPNIDQRVGVAITGPLQTLRVRLFSEPELSDQEKLAWLVLGRAPDTLGRNDIALLQRAAIALLAGEGEAPTDTLMKSLGIDDITLRQGEGNLKETVVGVGKQINERLYLGYERGVNATTGTWQLTYRIARSFSLRAQSGLDNAVDLNWTWRLQETPKDASVRKSSIVPP
jgi:translocation and assembly module TamB